MIDELDCREAKELVALQDEERFDLVEDVAVVDFELLGELLIDFTPAYQSSRALLVQEGAGCFHHLFGLGLQSDLFQHVGEGAAV